jgi:hypothetical protein
MKGNGEDADAEIGVPGNGSGKGNGAGRMPAVRKAEPSGDGTTPRRLVRARCGQRGRV